MLNAKGLEIPQSRSKSKVEKNQDIKEKQNITVHGVWKSQKSLYVASEASYVYILNGQKFIKNSQFENMELVVLPDMSILIGQKLVKKAKIQILKCDIFSDFQTIYMNGFRCQFLAPKFKYT